MYKFVTMPPIGLSYAEVQTAGPSAEAVANAIRAGILAGVLEPGRRLTFPELCATHRVSAGMLREALMRLVYAGIAEAEGNLGFKVSQSARNHWGAGNPLEVWRLPVSVFV